MIELIDVHKTYVDKKGKETKALQGISYQFPQKGLIFILGKSGSGKSTMLNLLGLLDNYDSGQLLIDGKPSNDFTERERDTYRALNIGFVFQEFHIIDKYTIGQNIALALEIGKQEATGEQIADVLKKVGLEGFENRFSRGVSGGQKQRVAIARAIIKNPKIILADEPTGSLDSVTGRDIFELLRELSKENLVVVISHDTENAHRYADQIVELADGKIVDIYGGDGTTETVRLSVDQLDSKNAKEVGALIDEGKKVILVKKPKQKPKAEAVEAVPMDLSTRVKIPTKSSWKLSMLAMRAKWVRMLMTVFLSMFAIAFFGFADMIGQFSVNRVMAEELRRMDLPFANVALFSVDESGMTPIRHRRMITDDHIARFDELDLGKQGVQFSFPFDQPARLVTFANFFPGRRGVYPFFANTIYGVIEVESPANDNLPNALGLGLAAGRWPQTTYEVVITNYQLEMYKMFGIVLVDEDKLNYEFENDGWVFNPNLEHLTQPLLGRHTVGAPLGLTETIESFEDIEGRAIIKATENFINRRSEENPGIIRIVGLVEFDMERFELVARQDEVVTQITDQQRDILRSADGARRTHLNNFIAMPGFMHELVRLNSSGYLGGRVSAGLTLNGTPLSNRINASPFQPMPQRMVAPGSFWADDILKRQGVTIRDYQQAIVSMSMLVGLLPNSMREQFEARVNTIMVQYPNTPRESAMWQVTEELVTDENILDGMSLNFAVTAQIRGVALQQQVNGFEVIAVYRYWTNPAFAVTDDFFENFVVTPVESLLVPASNNSQRLRLLYALSSYGRFSEWSQGEYVINDFLVWSANAQEIYFLDNMFGLFVSIFTLASVVFSLFAILLTYSFISASINSRKRDIGILRSLGAGRRDIASIFFKEGVIIVTLKIGFATLMCFAFYSFLSMFFISQLGYLAQTYTLVSFTMRQVLLMAMLAVIGVTISIAWPIIRIARKQPVEVIRDVQ